MASQNEGPADGQSVEFRTQQKNAQNPNVMEIDPKELFEKRSQVFIVDVRQPDEFTGELGHIAGASLIMLATLPQRLDEIPRDKTVVFVCASGGRSARATAFASTQGFDKVYNLKGGMQLWNELALETEGRSGT